MLLYLKCTATVFTIDIDSNLKEEVISAKKSVDGARILFRRLFKHTQIT